LFLLAEIPVPRFTESNLVAILRIIGPVGAARALAVAFNTDQLHEIAQRLLVKIEEREENVSEGDEG
jgi:hypothetical protein